MRSANAITYVTGDATKPVGAPPFVIAHVCNDLGRWGAGFVLALSKRWKKPEAEYRRWFREGSTDLPAFALGEVQFVQVTDTICVANMIGQHGVSRGRGAERLPPVRYEAVDRALVTVASHVLSCGASVHMPRIGCGLAGGRWELIEPLLVSRLCQRGIAVTVYDLQNS